MNLAEANREQARRLTDSPNIGNASAQDLIGRNAYAMYDKLCMRNGQKIAPCTINVFLSAVDFINDGKPKPRRAYTTQRKTCLQTCQPE
ncbi:MULTISPECIES: helix-hairpin-helix domain-containing protein [unclassified Neisseria]|uniref:helix-hairpin-helix domain-containing protein n=1 Tax=unclassified Neisseria TaxID=2623750 RepID=UPI00266531B2|nr:MULTISPECIES: helix-hairpin-helix domain-containing protein [unclassified Neisseria]MDO1509820.1 helix-hairpin-helix domain-containing protein [Neisseria sp. MVDL19-042950]MDO1515856.1 helix-hairpin-helix domain-containing protein [Neisseria sp. MVDL18-041461]MDO1562969.1 helix-hairpin-helix domain-containing protein [Neisseria sp. MVDL20-010259]